MKKFFAVFFSVVAAISFVFAVSVAKHNDYMSRVTYMHVDPIVGVAVFGRDDGHYKNERMFNIYANDAKQFNGFRIVGN